MRNTFDTRDGGAMPSEQYSESLRLFIQKVEKLSSLSIVEFFEGRGARVNVWASAEPEVLEIASVGPTGEQVDAFVLTLRLFMQDNDQISIRRMADLVANLPVSANLRGRFQELRENLNAYLDATATFVVADDSPTRREVLETVLYGNLSHLNAANIERYQSWTAHPGTEHFVNFDFAKVIDMFLRTLVRMADTCRRALWELEGNAPDDYPHPLEAD